MGKRCANCDEVGFTPYVVDPKLDYVSNMPSLLYVCNNTANCGIAIEQAEYDEQEDVE